MSLYSVRATTRCRHCGEEFAEHQYVPDSIDVYLCPRLVTSLTYGFFAGGDPRSFLPDPEASTDEERERHREACERGECLDCPSISSPGLHVTVSLFRLGVMAIEEQTHFEALDEDPPDEEFD